MQVPQTVLDEMCNKVASLISEKKDELFIKNIISSNQALLETEYGKSKDIAKKLCSRQWAAFFTYQRQTNESQVLSEEDMPATTDKQILHYKKYTVREVKQRFLDLANAYFLNVRQTGKFDGWDFWNRVMVGAIPLYVSNVVKSYKEAGLEYNPFELRNKYEKYILDLRDAMWQDDSVEKIHWDDSSDYQAWLKQNETTQPKEEIHIKPDTYYLDMFSKMA